MAAGAADRLDVPGGRPLPAGGNTGVAGEAPYVVRNALSWFALGAASANVVMQLSRLPVGRGVAESKVDSGRLDKHPIKRGRTTLSYVAVAWHGTDRERAWIREEVGRSHRPVRSDASSPVKYNAFDRELQLWVAACLYKGTEDVLNALYGPLGDAALDDLYRHAARFGTTLQVPADMWPADRQAFAEYWKDSLGKLEMDRVTRGYLRAMVDLSFLPAPARWTLGRFSRFVTMGFLPPEFREELGLPWSERSQARFEGFTRRAALLNRALPRPLRAFPWNLYLRDARRRHAKGRPFV
ncbi:oxygenase MpaB family protein [Actinomadura vinacea]|uniref:Oxygenase MpaB family protein n=1 Tax=Actinomadura vinacea TaxID=115336 RepID=A0ABP5VV12_9ACTN